MARKLGRGTLKLKGQEFDVTLFEDKKDPKKAVIFLRGIRKSNINLPKKATLKFKGQNLKAKLETETDSRGRKVKAFKVKLPKKLRKTRKSRSKSLTQLGNQELGSINGGLSL